VSNRTFIEWSHTLHSGDVGDVVTFAVAVAACDGLAAAGDGRPAHRQNSWELHASCSSSNRGTETTKRIIGQLCQLLGDAIKEVLMQGAIIVVKLCHRRVHTCWVDPLGTHAADIWHLFGSDISRRKTIIYFEMMKPISASIIQCAINVSSLALTLCSTFWTWISQDLELSCFPGRQNVVDGGCGEGNKCWVDFINQWSIIHSQ